MWKKIFNTNDPAESAGKKVITKQNTINEKEVERRAIAQMESASQMEAAKISHAYDQILNTSKVLLRNDQAHYEAFKAERLERFEDLDIVVADICSKNLGIDSYTYNRFKRSIFSENVTHKLIEVLGDIIERIIIDSDDEYTPFTESKKNEIKVLSIAIINLAEGNM